eukprot:NODE_10274_length_291_cov_52.809917_g8506_i0.p2 GENE.NODE_10274_length_291_cov_52.809917_g8506_i0~~NODE_10274_length_291_cov_52.809917_g8506_i0.p2  ORF type:complete len:88 (+),score=37.69 NODE_10274_length_291_cov_52.809917_g8506_i0:23-265(+)
MGDLLQKGLDPLPGTYLTDVRSNRPHPLAEPVLGFLKHVLIEAALALPSDARLERSLEECWRQCGGDKKKVRALFARRRE